MARVTQEKRRLPNDTPGAEGGVGHGSSRKPPAEATEARRRMLRVGIGKLIGGDADDRCEPVGEETDKTILT